MPVRGSAVACLFVLVSLALFAQPAAAADGWYGALDIGRATYQGIETIPTGPFAFTPGESTHPIAYRLDAGYSFTPNFSVEGGYVYLGTTENHANDWQCQFGNGSVMCGPADFHYSLRTSGLVADAAGTLRVTERLSLFAEGGFIEAHSVNGLAESQPQFHFGDAAADSANSIRPMFGAGADWIFSERMAVRLSWTRYQNLRASIGKNSFDRRYYSVQVLALGLRYSF